MSEQEEPIPSSSSSPPVQALITNNLPIPEKFSGANAPQQADLWPKWFKRFERYRVASGLKNKSENEQVSTLLYSMGECADDILKTLNINEETATYEEVKTALNKYYQVRRNVLVERAKFNKRVQQPGELVDTFIQDLYKIADDCEYGTLKDELIRDRIIVGVLDETLSDRLQAKAELSLQGAVQMSRQAEARKQNKEVVRGGAQSSTNTVNFIKGHTNNSIKPKPEARVSTSPTHKNKKSVNMTKSTSKCAWCGNCPNHNRKYCPAKNAICHKCNKRGHFQAVCRKNKPRVDEVQEEDPNPFFLGEIQGTELGWTVDVEINGHPTLCKLDTGAAVSVVSDSIPWVKEYLPSKTVKQTLTGPGGRHLPVLGSFLANLKYKQTKIQEQVYVIKNQSCSLLSRRACVNLGLVKRTDGDVAEVGYLQPDFKSEFPQLFTGLGKLQNECHITLQDDAKPFCLYTPRKVPHPLLPKVKFEIGFMLRQGVISPVTVPTKWCSGMVTVPKPNGRVRICVDLTQLNKGVQREIHPMPSVDENLAKLGQGKVFSKLDANSGFWQIPLDEESKLLTTFITPFGRYCFNRLPFGISSAPEIFQRSMSNILEGLPGVICQVDDVLIHGKNQREHDERVRAVLTRIQDAGLTLNEKCEFSKTSVKFIGHVIDSGGVHIDPEKTNAISNFPRPCNVTELQRFMGMVNHVGKFIPDLASINEPLRQLLCKKNSWVWGGEQERAFQSIKEILQSPTVLAHYDPHRTTFIAADASASGIGAILLQLQEDGERRPVSYASRSLNETERRYAVIEKEALATTWACEKFSQYITGLQFTVETDHKPLTALLNTKELSKLPARIQRFRLRLMRFNPDVVYVPGKYQITADALSRAPVNNSEPTDDQFTTEVESFALHVVNILPATPDRLQEITQAQKADEECLAIRKYCIEGWPAYMPHNPLLRPYWEARAHLSIVDDLLLYDDRLVIPKPMRLEILDKLHVGHLGITKCRARAVQSVWWPGLSSGIEDMVTKCTVCAKSRPPSREPLLTSSFPSRPWERLGTDLFELSGKTYIVIVDYYSRWMDIRRVTSQSSENIISILKDVFATHGIPDIIVSDNGPQYASESFKHFAQSYGFLHVTSSPRYPQANGEAERAVRTAKDLLRKNEDPYMSLLTYRSTPLQNGLSPSELLMGRRLRTQLPVLPSTLMPKQKDLKTVKAKEDVYRSNQQKNFNQTHKAKELPLLQEGEKVWIRDQDREGCVLSKTQHPRSYLVKTDKGILRRNRTALVSIRSTKQTSSEASPQKSPTGQLDDGGKPMLESPEVIPSTSTKEKEKLVEATPSKENFTEQKRPEVITRSGRVVRPPKYLGFEQ